MISEQTASPAAPLKGNCNHSSIVRKKRLPLLLERGGFQEERRRRGGGGWGVEQEKEVDGEARRDKIHGYLLHDHFDGVHPYS